MYEALHAAGIPMRQNRYYPNPADQVNTEIADRIVARYLAGAGPQQIAAELSMPVKRVRRIIAARGVQRSRGEAAALAHASRSGPAATSVQWSPELEASVLERYTTGESGEVVAAALGVSASRVYRLLRKRGVVRSQREAQWLRGESRSRAEPVREAPDPEVRNVPAERRSCPPGWPSRCWRVRGWARPRAMAVAFAVPANRVYWISAGRGVPRSRAGAGAELCAGEVARKKAEAGPAGGRRGWSGRRS